MKLKGPLAPNQTHKNEIRRGKRQGECLAYQWGEEWRAISKRKPIFAVLMMEFTPSLDPITFYPLI